MTDWTPDGPNCRQCGRHDYALHYPETLLSNPFARCTKHADCPLATKPLAPQERWAAVPRWTSERPTVGGWYWWRHGAATGCVLVREEGDALLAYFAGHQLGRPVHRQDGEWAGPLEAP